MVVVGATAVVVGAVSTMVVAQPESNEVIVSSAIAEIFFMVLLGVNEYAIADKRVDRDFVVFNEQRYFSVVSARCHSGC